VPYTLRQEPGPNNAMGVVKLIFPNEHFVFLHDTPSRSLFDRAERAFSSGCIRVEDPLRLTELVLDDPTRWDRAALEAKIGGGVQERVNLREPMPVLIVYLTASLEPDGRLRFLKDIYARDERLLEALDGDIDISFPGTH
jgi:murein L,D-transpeptidase YcbB/YkuD